MRAILLIALVACAREETTPEIRVVPNAAARASWLDWPTSRLPPSPPPATDERQDSEPEPSEK